jgi:Bacterial SH3 domain
MSVKALLVVLVLGVVAWPKPGHAEKVKTNQSTKLYSRAGEQSPVILKVKSGQTMTVLSKDGRWLKVRVSGRTGWVPRSKVDMPDGDDEISRNTRRRPFVDGRGIKRGFGGEGGPDDRVGADATGDGDDSRPGKGDKPDRSDKADKDDGDDGESKPRAGKPAKAGPKAAPKASRKERDDGDGRPAKGSKDDDDVVIDDTTQEAVRPMAHVASKTAILNDPNKNSDESFTAGPKTALYVVEEKGKWTFVENDEGDAGYVLTSKLDVDQPAGGGGPRTRMIDVRGRLGVTLVRQSVATPGGPISVPDNYSASSSSFTIALGGSVVFPFSKRFWVGGELAYDFDKAIPGISYMNQTTSFSYHVLNLRAVGGYDLQKKNGMTVFARLGFHYDSFQVSDVGDYTKNTAKLPNQIIQAPTIGAALAIPLLTKEIGLVVSLDVIAFGASVQQTKNLEDGTGPSAKALFVGGRMTYRWKPKMDLQATYDLTYTSLSFSGMPPALSERGHMGTTTSSGSDFNNALAVGIAYAF